MGNGWLRKKIQWLYIIYIGLKKVKFSEKSIFFA